MNDVCYVICIAINVFAAIIQMHAFYMLVTTLDLSAMPLIVGVMPNILTCFNPPWHVRDASVIPKMLDVPSQSMTGLFLATSTPDPLFTSFLSFPKKVLVQLHSASLL